MSYRETDSIFEIKYQDEHGRKCKLELCAESKSDAQRMFNSEKEPGEKLLSVKKIG